MCMFEKRCAQRATLAFLLVAGVNGEGFTQSRPALVRRPADLHSFRLGRAELRAAAEPTEAALAWHSRVLKWGDTHASAAWYPCLLGLIGFMDPFTLCGFLVTPLLTLGVCVADRRWAFVLCAAVWAGCLAGNFAFVALIGRFSLATRLAGSVHLATAGELLQRHGPIAGVMNTILPLPTVPLMVAAHAVKATQHGRDNGDIMGRHPQQPPVRPLTAP